MKRFTATLMLVAAGVLAFGQADPAVVAKIVNEGKNNNQVMSHLKFLTGQIGPRLSSSPSLQRACEWTMARFRAFGCTNVHLEKWGEWEVGFQRGKRQIARMTSPIRRDFEFTSASWTPGTNGLVKGAAVIMPTTMEEYAKVKGKLKGAWLVSRTSPRRGTAVTDEQKALQDAINAEKPAGFVSGSRNELVLTGGRQNITWDTLPTEVRPVIRKSDMDAVFEQLEAKKPVTLEFDMEQEFVKGPRPLYNVVAEIRGTEKPDEVVIVSGHLDSWDGPGSEGALDNGTGTMVALEAARILGVAGAKPKRTIRFIMWTGEEQGLFGSRAYVEAHKGELEKISAVFVDDGGTNYQGGVTCTEAMAPMLREAFKPAMDAFPDLPMEIRVAARIPRGGGSDHAPFNAAGVPGFFWFETGRSDYNFVHHTQHDSYKMAIPEYLVQSSTNSAAAAYIIACAPTLLPRETPPPK